MQVGDYAQQDERLGAGVEDAVAVTLGAVVAHARTEGILLAIVETDALAGEHEDHLTAPLVGVQADGRPLRQRHLQHLAVAVVIGARLQRASGWP